MYNAIHTSYEDMTAIMTTQFETPFKDTWGPKPTSIPTQSLPLLYGRISFSNLRPIKENKVDSSLRDSCKTICCLTFLLRPLVAANWTFRYSCHYSVVPNPTQFLHLFYGRTSFIIEPKHCSGHQILHTYIEEYLPGLEGLQFIHGSYGHPLFWPGSKLTLKEQRCLEMIPDDVCLVDIDVVTATSGMAACGSRSWWCIWCT